MQEGHVICNESIKLNEHEINYVTHDLELDAIVHALKMWRNYLLGRIFVLMTNHSGLRYFFDQTKINARQAIWMSLLSEFDFEINHIKGKENRVFVLHIIFVIPMIVNDVNLSIAFRGVTVA
jgi:hypothetical protein